MANKLTLEHLSIAFSNNQKVLYFDDERELNQICKIVELREEEMTISNGEYQYDVSFDDVKLISRSLSDLTKEIEVNGEKFVPIEFIEEWNTSIDFVKELYALQEDIRWLSTTSYVIYQQLLEWHFDVFGLIEKDLAIDINTL